MLAKAGERVPLAYRYAKMLHDTLVNMCGQQFADNIPDTLPPRGYYMAVQASRRPTVHAAPLCSNTDSASAHRFLYSTGSVSAHRFLYSTDSASAPYCWHTGSASSSSRSTPGSCHRWRRCTGWAF